MAEEIIPFRIDVPDADLADLRDRLRRTRWPDQETVDDWSQGAPLAWVQDLCQYWASGYDWRAREARLNSFPQFRTTIDGLDLHFLHVRSPHDGALPLVLTSGWPGSVTEFSHVIGPLTDPAGHGGDPADAFHVVCPSLPGYGFSGKPAGTGWNVQRIAAAWATLMARLGYPRYGAQGSDWGTSVTTSLGQQDTAHLAGIHVMPPIAQPDPATLDDLTEAERASLAELRAAAARESGYSAEQSTKPQTVGYGLVDSPAGLAAWIGEKFWSWTDHDGSLDAVISRDDLLDDLMLYWLPGTAGVLSPAVLGELRPGVGLVHLGGDRHRRRSHRVHGVPARGAASVPALGRETLHRHPALERAGSRRPLRRPRAARDVRRGGAGVLPPGPVTQTASRGPCDSRGGARGGRREAGYAFPHMLRETVPSPEGHPAR